MVDRDALWLWLALPVLFFIGWSYTAMVVKGSLAILKEKAIVLLIAHPDDEAMFFSPTVLGLTKPELGNHLKILCLSNGDADGLGAIRSKEIVDSALRLGLRSAADVLVLDDPRYPDSWNTWAASDVSNLLSDHFLKSPNSTTGNRKSGPGSDASTRPETTIDVLITFDATGVSSHPNHRSLYHGAIEWVRGLTEGAGRGWQSPVVLYSLTSVNILRKYVGFWDAPVTLALNAGGNFVRKGKKAGRPDRMLFLNDVGQWIRAMGTMVNAHKSQMVWFRWGWVGLGRYMVVNDLQRVDVGR